jgi:predicted MFS family arabinose efflux permease
MSARPYVVVWLLFVLAWTANFAIRIGFSTLLAPIMAELGLSYARAGTLAAAFFYAYVIMQIPAGLLGDRFGRRRILVIGLAGVAVATALTGLAGSFAALFAARLLTGAFQGSLFSNDRATIAAVTPRDRIAFGQGISFSGPGLGLLAGLYLSGVLAEALSWRAVLFLFALGPLVAAAAIQRWAPAIPPAPAASVGGRLREVLGERRLWVLNAAGACGIYGQFVLATWAPLMFEEAGVSELGRAGGYASLQGLAAVAGPVVGGWIDDRLWRRGVPHAWVMAGGLVALAAGTGAMALTIAARSPLGLALALVAAAFFAWSIWGAVYADLGEVVRPENLGTAFGFLNSIAFIGAIVGPTVTGLVRDVAGTFAAGCWVAAVVAVAGALIALAGGRVSSARLR